MFDRRGGGGGRWGGGVGGSTTSFGNCEIFLGQKAHNSGNSTWEKTEKTGHRTERKETTTVVPKRQAKCAH